MENNLEAPAIYYERRLTPGLIGIDNAALAKQLILTYFWMILGLLTTGLVSLVIYQAPILQYYLYGSKEIFFTFIFLQIAVVIVFSSIIDTCKALTAFILYFIYAGLLGVTLSVILQTYQLVSIIHIFLGTAFAFIGLSLYGLATQRCLNAIGSFCISGLFAILGLMLLYFLFPPANSDGKELVISVMGVIVLSGLTAYDSQKLKEHLVKLKYVGSSQTLSINAALYLYLDFINLFLFFLRIFGGRK